MKKLLLTHSDLDGVGCAIVALHYHFYSDHIYFADYTELNDGVLTSQPFYRSKPWTMFDYIRTFDLVFVTDLSIDPPFYEFLSKEVKNFTILDHHDSSSFIPKEDSRLILDNNKSGTRLLFEYLSAGKRVPVALQEFVEIVDTYDMWKKDSPLWATAEKLNGIFYQMRNYNAKGYYKYSDYIKVQLGKIAKWEHFDFTAIEEKHAEKDIEKKQRNLSKAYDNIQYREDTHGKKFALTSIPASLSYVASVILDDDESLDYIVIVNTYREAKGKISLRSKEMDCTLLNHANGHKLASGGELSDQEIIDLISGKMYSLGYKEDNGTDI